MRRTVLLLVVAACGGRVLDDFSAGASPGPPPPSLSGASPGTPSASTSDAAPDVSTDAPAVIELPETSVEFDMVEEALPDAHAAIDALPLEAASSLCASPEPLHDKHGTASAPYCEGGMAA